MSDISPEQRAKAVQSPRFAVLSQLEASVADFRHLDTKLIREPRLLVPVDVCALVVRDGDEPMVRLPFRDGGEADTLAPVDDAGTVREAGVHLLWSVPKAFGRGTVVDDPSAPGDAARRVLELPVLPDRWLVLRLAVGSGESDPRVRGWVLEADGATATPLEDWPANRSRSVTLGTPVPVERLTIHVGGPAWTQSYDAALGRLAFFDPLDDLATAAPNGIEGDALTYVVAGWWADPRHDPLDGIGSLQGYQRRLHELGWDDPDHPAPEISTTSKVESKKQSAASFGIERPTRYAKVAAGSQSLSPAASGFVIDAIGAALLPGAPTRSTLLHGRIHGVPLRSANRPDDRPSPERLKVALGPTSPSVAAVLASGALDHPDDADSQRNAERLLTAFSSGLLGRIEQPDTWPDIDQYEQAQAFGAQPGGTEAVDRFVDRPPSGNDPGSSARVGRRSKPHREAIEVSSTILWSRDSTPAVLASRPTLKVAAEAKATPSVSQPSVNTTPEPQPTVREVKRPAPPYHLVAAPVMAITGPGRRILAAERDEADGLLRVRTSDQPVSGPAGLASGTDLLRTLGSGALPDEVLTLAREALAEDPYIVPWRTRRNVTAGYSAEPVAARLRAEAAVNYAYYAGDDARLSQYTFSKVDSAQTRQLAVEGLLRHSIVDGVWSHPEGVTMWGQPWRPLFCEWSVDIDLAELGAGWTLGETDLVRVTPHEGGNILTFTGRSPLVTSVASTLQAAVEKWLEDERARDDLGRGLASDTVEAAMVGLREHLAQLDVLSVALDGLRERLLGLEYDRGLVRDHADAAPDGSGRAVAAALPQLVAGGRLTIRHARLVDAFGRTLSIPVERAVVAARAVDDPPAAGAVMALPPRITAPARLHLRFVDPLAVTGTAATACVDQKDPANQVNPVAGFLLPDHIDEALEVFAADGAPLGQLGHDPFSDAVFWEGAPGRTDVGPGAGPLDDPDPTRQRLGWLAAALVSVDAAARQATPTRPETESPLSALLRAVDTTLWTVDPLGSLGSEHIAGLVGRPIAVVTAHLTLDVIDDLDELVYAEGTSREARAKAYAELATVPFTVRLGCATRSDDGLLGYFVDDDYTKLHVVDRVIAEQAKESGRCRGDLGVSADGAPPEAGTNPILHPYIVPDGTVTVRLGQTVRLTLLMHPGGRVHVTAGIVPRSYVALARDWVHPGLSVMAPSVRCGPLLIDADKVRLPKVSAFPADQLFTRRDTPGSWRDDPILAATQTAYLPDQASEVQEGWIRIAPTKAGG